MKRLVNPISSGGAPINNEQLNELFQTEIHDSIEAILSPFDADAQGIIVSGCVISGGGPYNISAGIVYLNGEFMRLAAATGQTLPKYIAPKAVSYITKQFSTGATNNLIEVKEAELVGSAPGAGQYVAITTTTDPDDRRFSNFFTLVNNLTTADATKPLTAAQGKIVNDKFAGTYFLPVATGAWDMDTTGNILVNHTIADITKIIGVSAVIRKDDGTQVFPVDVAYSNGVVGLDLTCQVITTTQAQITRAGGSIFDSADFDDPIINRGYLVFHLLA